jgi:hypothetical protein
MRTEIHTMSVDRRFKSHYRLPCGYGITNLLRDLEKLALRKAVKASGRESQSW